MAITLLGNGQAIVQIQQAYKVNAQTLSGATYVDVSGLSVSITPTSSSNRILVIANIDFDGYTDFCIARLLRGSTVIGNSTAGSDATKNGFGYMYGSSSGAGGFVSSISYIDSPATTSATTYKIQASVGNGGTMYVNRSNNGSYGGTSNITVMEISG